MKTAGKKRTSASTIGFAFLAVVIIGILSTILIRLQRGFLGLFLIAIAAVLTVFWIRELRKTIAEEWSKPIKRDAEHDTLELIPSENGVMVVTQAPGPRDLIVATVNDRQLHLQGARGFRKTIALPERLEISTISYVNGVLTVKLRRTSAPPSDLGADKGFLTP